MMRLYQAASQMHEQVLGTQGYSTEAIWIPTHPLLAFVRHPAAQQPLEREFALMLPAGHAGQAASVCVYRSVSESISAVEAQASMDWHAETMGRAPWFSLAVLLQIDARHVSRLPGLGEYAPPRMKRDYHSIAVRIGAFPDILALVTEPGKGSTITLLCYCLPAFIFPYGPTFQKPRLDWFRNDYSRMSEAKFKANSNVNHRSQGWLAEKPLSAIEIARRELDLSSKSGSPRRFPEHLSAVIDIPQDRIDEELSIFKRGVVSRGRAREEEIRQESAKGLNESDDKPPDGWPKRLLDVVLNAIIPGENVWYFRKEYLTISYPWEHDGRSHNQEVWFSHQSVPTTGQGAYQNFLQVAGDFDAVEYVWLDALCIYQDEEEDKRIEVSTSYLYYQRCKTCLIFPTGLSGVPSIQELLGPTLPRWFERSWTLPEALCSQFLVFQFQEGFFDRFEVLDYVDANVQQTGSIIQSVRRLLRREGMIALHPARMLLWALCRDAGRIQDIVHAILGPLRPSLQGIVQVDYETTLSTRILQLAGIMQDTSRTSLVTICAYPYTGEDGPSWLPHQVEAQGTTGFITVSSFRSELSDDGSLEIFGTTAQPVLSQRFHPAALSLVHDVRYSTEPSVSHAVERAALAAAQNNAEFDGPADNAIARAWLAITYLASVFLEVELRDMHIRGRVFVSDTKLTFTHVIPIGSTTDAPIRERVYLLATLQNGHYKKKGLLLELACLGTDHEKAAGSITLR